MERPTVPVRPVSNIGQAELVHGAEAGLGVDLTLMAAGGVRTKTVGPWALTLYALARKTDVVQGTHTRSKVKDT
jgi:hypothetical protein